MKLVWETDYVVGGHSTSKSLDSNHGPSGKCNQLAHSSSITNNITCRGGGESWELFSIQQSEDSDPLAIYPFYLDGSECFRTQNKQVSRWWRSVQNRSNGRSRQTGKISKKWVRLKLGWNIKVLFKSCHHQFCLDFPTTLHDIQIRLLSS